MASQSEINLIKKSKIIAMLQVGKSNKEIIEEVGCDIKTIKKWSYRYQDNGEDGFIDKRNNNCGPRKTTGLEDLMLWKVADENPFQSITKTLNDSNLNISVRSAQRIINNSGLLNRPTAKKCDLSLIHLQKRLKYAHDHLHWTPDQWSTVIWSDEKSFKASMDCRRTCWRPRDARLDPKYVVSNWRSNRLSSMFWGCMSSFGLMDLVQVGTNFRSKDYIEVLEQVMLPAARRDFPAYKYPKLYFMQDNSPVHTAKIVQDWFGRHPDIVLLAHPPMSPDLNPIENIWGLMDQKWNPINRPKTINDLNNYTEQLWNELSNRPDYCRNTVNSMNARLKKVIAKDGYWINY